MLIRIAFRARQSQASGAGIGGLLLLFMCLVAAFEGPEALPAPRPKWFEVSIAEYQSWRELLARNPAEARKRVARAISSVQAEKELAPLAGEKILPAQARRTFEQRVWRDRGLLVWRTLETVIDRERVDRALQLYASRGRAGGTDGFRKACEEISGRDLQWFFDYYIAGTQLPEITLRRTAGNAPNELAGEIVVRNAPQRFQVRVEMRLSTAGGVIEHSVATNGPVTPFTITTKDPVLRIAVDPDNRILRRISSP